jgi:hypothetical protein
LILDIEQKQAFVLPTDEAREFLGERVCGQPTPVSFTETEVQAMFRDGVSDFHAAKWGRVVPSLTLPECQRACDSMMAWLAEVR